ncbi:MAG: hypothetical protein ABII22_02545 [Candidatus Micrarchaeota archaeon]
MVKQTVCPKCKGKLVKGLITESQSFPLQRWVEKMPILGLLSLKDTKLITAYRCKNCGFIEQYAQ